MRLERRREEDAPKEEVKEEEAKVVTLEEFQKRVATLSDKIKDLKEEDKKSIIEKAEQ